MHASLGPPGRAEISRNYVEILVNRKYIAHVEIQDVSRKDVNLSLCEGRRAKKILLAKIKYRLKGKRYMIDLFCDLLTFMLPRIII